ncbi:MAG: hypothetical protein AB1782_07685 [Cyanobacteriota bacterium]
MFQENMLNNIQDEWIKKLSITFNFNIISIEERLKELKIIEQELLKELDSCN